MTVALITTALHSIQQPSVICRDLQVYGNYHFPRPEMREQYKLYPHKGPAKDVLSEPIEEVWSASGAATNKNSSGTDCSKNKETGSKITTDLSHPRYSLFHLLPSGRYYIILYTKTTRKEQFLSSGNYPHKQVTFIICNLLFKSANMLFTNLLPSTLHLQILYCKNSQTLHPCMLHTLFLLSLLTHFVLYIAGIICDVHYSYLQ